MPDEQSTFLRTVLVDDRRYRVYGCADRTTPASAFDYYEVATEDGETLRLGDPLYASSSGGYIRELVTCTECNGPRCAGMLTCPSCGTERHDDSGGVATVLADHGHCDDCQENWRAGRVAADD
jgi:hypothetical protein